VKEAFHDFDFADFWDDNDYSLREYVDSPVTPDMVALVERELGYKLPSAYVELARRHNGGMVARDSHPVRTGTSWAEDHVSVHGIYSIGSSKSCSLLGRFGSKFWAAEWGYPDIGVYFADCPSAGHDMLCLDYRACGPRGEPQVVHVDQELDYAITHVADDFESFIRGLLPGDAFDDETDPPSPQSNIQLDPAKVPPKTLAAGLHAPDRLPRAVRASVTSDPDHRNIKVRPATRVVAAVLIFGILAGFVFALWMGGTPRRPDWSEALGVILIVPTLGYVAITGQAPRWVRWLDAKWNG